MPSLRIFKEPLRRMWESIEGLTRLSNIFGWTMFVLSAGVLIATGLSLRVSSLKDSLQSASESAKKERIVKMELDAEQLKGRNLQLEKDLADRFAPRALTMLQVEQLKQSVSNLKGIEFEIWAVPDWEASRFADSFHRFFLQCGLKPKPLEVVNGAAIGIGIVTSQGQPINSGARLIAKAFRQAQIEYYTLTSEMAPSGSFAIAFGQKSEGTLERKPTY